MNIIDAVKTGKRFRRPYMFTWFDRKEHGGLGLQFSDVLADDWEVEGKKVEITYEQLLAAFMTSSAAKDVLYNIGKMNDLAKKLGLID